MEPSVRTANNPKSPSGSLFPYCYKGGELHCLKYGSFWEDRTALFHRMDEEEAFFLASGKRMHIWIDMYETGWPRAAIVRLAAGIERLSANIDRLAIVGLDGGLRRWRLRHLLKKNGTLECTSVRFYDDPEKAKTWIVLGREEG